MVESVLAYLLQTGMNLLMNSNGISNGPGRSGEAICQLNSV